MGGRGLCEHGLGWVGRRLGPDSRGGVRQACQSLRNGGRVHPLLNTIPHIYRLQVHQPGYFKAPVTLRIATACDHFQQKNSVTGDLLAMKAMVADFVTKMVARRLATTEDHFATTLQFTWKQPILWSQIGRKR